MSSYGHPYVQSRLKREARAQGERAAREPCQCVVKSTDCTPLGRGVSLVYKIGECELVSQFIYSAGACKCSSRGSLGPMLDFRMITRPGLAHNILFFSHPTAQIRGSDTLRAIEFLVLYFFLYWLRQQAPGVELINGWQKTSRLIRHQLTLFFVLHSYLGVVHFIWMVVRWWSLDQFQDADRETKFFPPTIIFYYVKKYCK